MKRAILTVDLGFGDAGKGGSVDFLCKHFESDLVVRYSGGCLFTSTLFFDIIKGALQGIS
jgi:adenylosuccinate synthase